jgi:diazepam-binding inhibitor (GABA receptor modulating acyl-CoA-binding protein)
MADEVKAKFDESTAAIAKLGGGVPDGDMGELYGLYKQSTCGNCTAPSPPIYRMKEKRKWQAWMSKIGLTSQEAMSLYSNCADNILFEL